MPEMPEVQYEAAAGTPDQMGQGTASELNAQLPTDQPTAPDALVPAPSPYAGAEDQPIISGPAFKPGGQDEEILFGDSEGADAPTVPEMSSGRMPHSVVRWLSTMRAAANEPNAPASLRAIYAAAVNSLDNELRA